MCNEKELEFVIYLIHCLAENWKKLPAEVYQILNMTRVLDDYIIPCYDSLHTLGREYLVEDVTDFVREKGVVI